VRGGTKERVGVRTEQGGGRGRARGGEGREGVGGECCRRLKGKGTGMKGGKKKRGSSCKKADMEIKNVEE